MEIKRGYVKWTDENGVFHKEPLADHPELLDKASPAQQIAAEEVRRLNAHAEEVLAERKADAADEQWDTLEALQDAPETVLTTGDLVAVSVDGEEMIVPAEEVAEPVTSEELWSEDHEEALMQLKRETT
jgi:hypothetical protein